MEVIGVLALGLETKVEYSRPGGGYDMSMMVVSEIDRKRYSWTVRKKKGLLFSLRGKKNTNRCKRVCECLSRIEKEGEGSGRGRLKGERERNREVKSKGGREGKGG